MGKSESPPIYHVTTQAGNELGVNTDFLVSTYRSIDTKARQLAPAEIRNELLISQDGAVKTTFHVKVSDRMAPYLIDAIQQQTDAGYGTALKSYLYKLQEQIMAQMFASVEQASLPRFGL